MKKDWQNKITYITNGLANATVFVAIGQFKKVQTTTNCTNHF